MEKLKCSPAICAVLGVFLISFGIVLILLWSSLFEYILKTLLILSPNSILVKLWQKAPIPVALDFYFFNWTNPHEINDPKKKPKFKELGPYSFIDKTEKVNLTWNDNNTISYRLLRYWYFDEENSKGKLSDEVITLNAVSMSAAHQVKTWSYFMKKGFSISLTAMAPTVHITRTVRELLFDGYDDPLIDMAMAMPFLANTMPPFDKFGWFYSRNGSYTFDGIFNIANGVDGNLGELTRWNHYKNTPYFKGKCGRVHGSAAELYPRNCSRDHIGFFSQDMCRYVKLDYEEDTFVENIAGYKYSGQDGMLDNGTLRPENKCYCNGECIPSGLLNISSCRYGTPSYVSLPHFYGADPIYLSLVEGLKPNKSKHELFITLEPKTALALDVAIRLQLNILLYPIQHITVYSKVPKIYFPILWFEQKVTIPSSMALMTKIFLLSPTITTVVGYLLIATGIIILLHCIHKFMLVNRVTQKSSYFSKEMVPLREPQHSEVPTKRTPPQMDFIYS